MKSIMIAAAALLALSACSSGPDPDTFGGRLALEGGEMTAIGESWTDAQERIERGRALVETGEDRIERGRNQISKGRKAVDRGEDEIARGRRLIAEGERDTASAEETYRRIVAAKATTVVPR